MTARAITAGGAGPRAARSRAPLVALALLALAPPAPAQERVTVQSLDARLQRVERVLDQSLLDQLQRIDALQQQMRELRGEIESLTYRLETETGRAADLYNDTDQRLTELERARTAVEPPAEGEDPGAPAAGDISPLDETSGKASDKASGVVIVPEDGAPGDGGAAAPGGDAASAGTDSGAGPRPPTGVLRDTATQAEKASYTKAYDLLARGQNEAAVAAFDDFLRAFPDGPYSDNAWYWQGEAMYAERRFDEARRNLGVVVEFFPESTKVPDAQLKIGYALYEQGAFEAARRILTSVQDSYPGRSAAVLARKRLQDMDREGR